MPRRVFRKEPTGISRACSSGMNVRPFCAAFALPVGVNPAGKAIVTVPLTTLATSRRPSSAVGTSGGGGRLSIRSQASPRASPSTFDCDGLGVSGQLSAVSGTPSLSSSASCDSSPKRSPSASGSIVAWTSISQLFWVVRVLNGSLSTSGGR